MIKSKKLIKLIIVLLLLMFVTITFSACAQVRVMTITNDDNSIDELVTVTIVPEEIISAGYNVTDLKTNISEKSQAEAKDMKDKLNLKISLDLLTTNDKETIEILNSFKDGIEVVKSDWKDNTYAIGIRFKNIDVYRYYYGISENVKVETQVEEHFWYDKIYYYSSTMYVKHHDLYDAVNSYYSVKYPKLINSESNELLYSYKTDLRRQHSDADYITYEGGEYYHTWIVDPENVDKPIMLYYNVANPENYIIVGLCVSLGVTVILTIVAIILKYIKKEKDNA